MQLLQPHAGTVSAFGFRDSDPAVASVAPCPDPSGSSHHEQDVRGGLRTAGWPIQRNSGRISSCWRVPLGWTRTPVDFPVRPPSDPLHESAPTHAFAPAASVFHLLCIYDSAHSGDSGRSVLRRPGSETAEIITFRFRLNHQKTLPRACHAGSPRVQMGGP